ncbi:MAG: metallophosphoesterase [Deltaproteobacteria bacterium]|nr:metallophosphoesterase [Deltaproteobacteria bacterium]MBW2387070.1 metallophosphoesterase [Deltaproteobacteria bacterium]
MKAPCRIMTLFLIVIAGCHGATRTPSINPPHRFSIAVIPDTQNYVDYTHQRVEGFALDANELFIAQMRDIASRDDVAFVASVGDVWQHQTLPIDPEHASRGHAAIENGFFASELTPTEKARTVEIPKAIEGYRLLAEAGIPFGVAPGNHDYDAMWSAAGFPPNLHKDPRELSMTPEDLGMFHIGGLDNFRSAFGSESDFFRDQKWYVASHAGGADSAQIFEAGGYRFLHIALEMGASDEVLAWATAVIERHSGLPTIVTTHDYLDPRGRRQTNPIVDLARVDPDHHNTAEEVFQEFIREHDEIFLVLCGHHHGQSRRVDSNRFGHDVHQLLADYQDRGQVGLDAGQPIGRWRGAPVGIGDGWYRLMTFDLESDPPRVEVRTWSSHYLASARDLETYAAWYRAHEQPGMSDGEFIAEDSFELLLDDFHDRFGAAID